MTNDELRELYKAREDEPIVFAEALNKLIDEQKLTYGELCKMLNLKATLESKISRCHQLFFLPKELQEDVIAKRATSYRLSILFMLDSYKAWRNDSIDAKKQLYMSQMREVWKMGMSKSSREFINFVHASNKKYGLEGSIILENPSKKTVQQQGVVSSTIKLEIKKIRESMQLEFSWDDTLTTQGNAERFLELLKAHMMVHELQYNNKAQVNNARLRLNLRKRLLRELPKNAKYCACGCKYDPNKVKELIVKDEKILQNERVYEEKAGIKRNNISEYVAEFSALLHNYKNGRGETA